MKVVWAALVFAAIGLSQGVSAQGFDTLYADSPQPQLAAPLQWLIVSKPDISKAKNPPSDLSALEAAQPDRGSGETPTPDLPAAFLTAPNAWAFQATTPQTHLPTSATQDVWMRFTLAPSREPQTWYLRIPRINPVRVSFFSLSPIGTWQAQSAGNLVAPALWPLRTRAPTFEIKTSTTESLTFFIHFENQSLMAERPQMLSAIEYITGAYGVGAMLGLLVGAFTLLTALCAMAYGLARNRAFLWLSAFVSAMLFNQLVLSGFAGWKMWPHSQQLNQNMPWASSFVAMAAGTWLMATATYAQDTHRWIYRLLGAAALLTLLLAVVLGVDVNAISREARNAWVVAVVVLVISSMVWLTLRGNRFNGWLLLGMMPIGLAALNRVAYNVGWLAHLEVAQALGLTASVIGLLILFSALVWRSRAALLFNRQAQALADYDPETGLLVSEKSKTRLPRLLLRGNRLKSGGGVILLRWMDAARYTGLAASAQRSQILRQIGDLIRAAGRDIDSLIRHDDHHFLMLIEGPVSRDALANMASQIMAASFRGKEAMPSAGALPPINLHIAIWQETIGTTTANNVMALLMRRLNTMGKSTPRRVQFIDSAVSDQKSDSTNEQRKRKQMVINKINKIEAEPRQPITLSGTLSETRNIEQNKPPAQ